MAGPVTVLFRPIASAAEADTIHVDNTKPFLTTAGKSVVLSVYREVRETEAAEDEVLEDGEAEETAAYEVEKVVDHRLVGGTIEFLLRWKGYSQDDDTWTAESDMSCHNLVEDYFQTLGATQQF